MQSNNPERLQTRNPLTPSLQGTVLTCDAESLSLLAVSFRSRDLSGSNFTTLPAGLFDGLDALGTL